MQKFYIQKDYQQQGPFSIDELKDFKITRGTMVWYAGLDDWIHASEVDDLKNLFTSIPPSVEPHSLKAQPPIGHKSMEVNSSPVSVKARKINTTILISVVAIVFIGGLGSFIYSKQQTKQAEIQRQLEEQNAKIQEQERLESIRLAKEEEQRRAAEAERKQAELGSLKYEYDQALTNLRSAKIRLNELQQFHLLRTSDEKRQQIKEQLDKIRSWENEVERLKGEIDKY